jgi:CheY-like chemotaxis protein
MPDRSGSKSVLIVEDDPDIREVLEEMLDAGGHRVVTATNGAEGAALQRGGCPGGDPSRI